MRGNEAVLQVRGINKPFGAVQALKNVDFEVRRGEVTALIGDNGAGKSTLINVISGVPEPDSGEIIFEGEVVEFASPHDARERGIETVNQDLAVAPQLDAVASNFLGRAPYGRHTGQARVSGPAEDAQGDRRTTVEAARADPGPYEASEHFLRRAAPGGSGGARGDVGQQEQITTGFTTVTRDNLDRPEVQRCLCKAEC